MSDKVKLVLITAIATIIFTVFIGVMVTDWYHFTLKNRCIEKRGEWIGDTCLFRTVDETIIR